MVFRTASVMLDIVTPAALDSYKDHVKQYALRYTADSWALLYQSDTRARRELSERIRRCGQSLCDKARQAGGGTGTLVVCDFDPTKPWDYVFRQLSSEFSFWKGEVEDPAMLILTRAVRGQSSVVSGEAPTAPTASAHIADVASLQGAAQTGQARGQPSPKKKLRLPPDQRTHTYDEAGNNTTNRRGVRLCPEFQK